LVNSTVLKSFVTWRHSGKISITDFWNVFMPDTNSPGLVSTEKSVGYFNLLIPAGRSGGMAEYFVP